MQTIAMTAAFYVFLLVFVSLLIASAIQIIAKRPAAPIAAGAFVFALLLFACATIDELGIEIGAKRDDDVSRAPVEEINPDEPEAQEPDVVPLSSPAPEEGEQGSKDEPVNVKITLDGKEIDPVDILGNPADPFIIDGSTYVPVRAVADALGLDVQWDADSSTVVLTSQKEDPANTESATPPSQETKTTNSSNKTTSNTSNSNNSSKSESKSSQNSNSQGNQNNSSSSNSGTSNKDNSSSSKSNNTNSNQPSGITLAPADPGNSQTQNNSGNTANASSGTANNNSGVALSLADPITNTGNSDNKSGNNSGGGNSNNFNSYDNAEQQKTQDKWVLNTNTKKIHYPTCNDVKKIADKNYATSNMDLSALLNQGYTTCGHCFK